ncbi:MAG: hypothetical protein GY771_09565, partial [bacterium]|nr:hypothetical protein [bacterium]
VVRYTKEASVVERVIDRATLISPRELDPGYIPKEEEDGGSIDDSDLVKPDNAGDAPTGKSEPETTLPQ